MTSSLKSIQNYDENEIMIASEGWRLPSRSVFQAGVVRWLIVMIEHCKLRLLDNTISYDVNPLYFTFGKLITYMVPVKCIYWSEQIQNATSRLLS